MVHEAVAARLHHAMRVLTLTNMYPPHHYGGYELSCWDVMRRLEARGHEIAVLTTDMRVAGVEGDDTGGGQVHRTLEFYWLDHELLSPPVWRRALIERRNRHKLAELLDRFRPDVVSVWNMGAMSLGMLSAVEEREIPMVLAVCDDWLVYGPNLDAWQRLFLARPRAARVVQAVTRVPTSLPNLAEGAFCFVSDFTRRRAIGDGFADINTSTVVFSGIDRNDFPPGPTPDRRSWSWRILYVGRIDDRKGIETLIKALNDLPEASLEILGRGADEYVASLHTLGRELGVDYRVQFGAVDRSELRGRYAAADVVVFPSEWDEPFGLVPVEAMSCETPVVATGTGGSAEFLRDGVNCLRFPPQDVAALVKQVRRLANDQELRARLVANGLITAAELDVDHLADTFDVWHAAAADRFAHGIPPDRVLELERVSGPPAEDLG
jgi:glycosyltransferase involved in cell wall biosynthesis